MLLGGPAESTRIPSSSDLTSLGDREGQPFSGALGVVDVVYLQDP